MDVPALIATFGPALATFLVSLVSAVVPFIYIEVYLVAIVALVPGGYATWTLGFVAAVGQMVGKSALYWGGRGATNAWTPAAHVDALGAEDARGAQRRRGLRDRLAQMPPLAIQGFTFTSALLGFPPMILVATAAGAAAVNFWPFALAGFAGRVVRFTATVAAAAWAHRLIAGP